MEIVAGLLRHPSPISIDGSEACEYLPYVFKIDPGMNSSHSVAILTSGTQLGRLSGCYRAHFIPGPSVAITRTCNQEGHVVNAAANKA